MTAPPIEDRPPDIHDGMEQVRAALQQMVAAAPEAAREEAQQVLDSDELVTKVVGIVVPLMDRRFRKKYYKQIVLAVGGLLVFIMLLAGLGYARINSDSQQTASKLAAEDAALKRSNDTIAAFQVQLDASNAKLRSEGLPTVAGPTGTIVPGSSDQAKLINAAATASTLAALPQVTTSPAFTTAQLAAAAAKAVADYMVTNPEPGVNTQSVIDAVAAYLQRNPVRNGVNGTNGEQGPAGPAGPPPTSAEITDSFVAAIKDNPQLLCPLGGTYKAHIVLIEGGGSAQQFSCFTDIAAPPPTTDSGLPPADNGGVATPGLGPAVQEPAPAPAQNQDPSPTPDTTAAPTAPGLGP